MSIFGMMRTATSGMNAQSNRLGTVGDNIANSSTAGYKRASTEFSSLILESGSGEYNSGSVETEVRYGISQQGGFDFTTSATDIAISGNGFLIVSEGSDAGAADYLTRAGSFVKDGDGYLVNSAGFYLLGVPWTNQSATPTIPSNGTSGLSPVQIQTLALQAVPSTAGTFNLNLPSTATVVAAGSLPSDNVVTSTYTAKSSLVVIDNLGAKVTLDIYATKSATAPDAWEITIFDSAGADPTTTFPYTGATVPLSTVTLTFDSLGQLDTALPSPTSITIPVPNGASLTLDMGETTQLATTFQVLEPKVDGSAPSAVDRVEIDDTGTLYAVYENGQREKKYLIPLATVPSPDNLIPRAGNVFDLSSDSGDLLVGAAGTAGLGNIVPKALEKSTVDIASELTDMIEAQHSFTANSKVFQTAADLMEVLVNLRR
jgi:flagellar hook protein FlgE